MSLGQSLQPSLRPELLPSKHYPSCEMTLYLRFRLGLPETSILTEISPEHGGTLWQPRWSPYRETREGSLHLSQELLRGSRTLMLVLRRKPFILLLDPARRGL